ncbi:MULTISPECIES: tape measure protein [unclassified Bacteroides]|jgi:tape measure domain-containing protein|uniref:tape measure protein n=1 Tax=unclassified Bacteroides TaxID=2646097 RepID=UPI000E8FFEBA|nr:MULTISPECIES: tape measure protein [unclassified Bacteroides]RGN50034.1 phage tail tape measure protein [Bacteroides sp. OM05-12]RHR75156.1 phage tail tape measure protein [Bacteroides sp. AF16-49]DAU20733.1 MAG TPA: tail tape measure protein [Caudoviricetes sp.]
MPKLVFRVASDWEEVVKLRNEIAKLKQELKGMDSTQSPAAFKTLNTQLAASTQRMDELVTNAAKAGAEMENGFKRKIFAASQSVNGFTEKIIAQKAVVKDVEADVKRLGDAYRTALKRNPLSANSKLDEYTSAKKTLDEEKAALFDLTQQQAEARLSVKKLRDEYSLYKNEGKQVVETNNGIAVSWKKALAVIGGTAVLKALGSEIIRVRGEFQSMQTAMETMVGKDVAGPLMAQVKELAKISPLTMTDMVGAEKMMLGFNIQAEDTIKYLKALSDISMGESGKFNSLTLAFSQMSATGKLMGQDLNQMINAGFNPLQTISEKTGKSIATLKDEMSKGAISAEMVQQAFLDATAAGGKFYNMSENASKTINGQISMMQDALDNAFNEMGEKSEGVIMSGIQAATSLIQNYETVGKVLSGLLVTYGAYRTAVMLVTAAESKHTLVEIGLTNTRILARKAQLALNAAMLTNPYVLLATAIVGLGAAMWAMSDSTTAAARAQKEYNDIKDAALKKEQEHKQKIDKLLTSARDESLATLTRQKSLEELRKEYPKIFEQYDLEKLKLEDILKLKQRINEEDSKRSVQERKDDYTSLKQTVANQQRYLQLFDNPELRKNMSDTDIQIWKMFAGKQSYVQVREQMEKNSELLKKYQKDVLEDNIAAYKVNLKNYSKEKLEAELKMAQSSASKRNGFNVGGMMVKGGDLESIISSINGALAEKKSPNTYKQDYDKAKKDWEDAKKKLTEIEKDKNKFTSKQYEEAKKREETTEKAYKKLGGLTGSKLTKEENQAEKSRKQTEKYNLLLDKQALEQQRSAEDLQMKVDEARIKAMDEGSKKTIAQMELNFEKEMQAIDRQKEDALRKKIDDARSAWETKPENKGKSFDATGIELSDDESKYFSELYKSSIDNFDKDKQRFKLQPMRDYLKEYGTFQQKKEAIALEYDEKIAASQNEWEKKSFEKQKTEALSAIDMEQFKQGINWELIFGDLSKVSKKSLEDVKLQLKSFKDSPEYKNMNVEQKKVIDEALNNIQTTIIDKGGLLGDLPEQLDALRMAQDELTKAQNEYNEAMENGTDEQKEAALKKKNAAQQGVTNAETNVTKAKDKTVSNLIILSDAITQLGSSSEMSLSQIGGLAENITNIFTEAGSKIGGIIGAAFSLLDVINKQGLDGFVENVFSSVFNAARGIWDTITFGAFSKITGSGDSDVNLEKDLEYLAQSNQDLKNALDNLSDKMDKASLTDASDIYNVQKDNIEKQMANTQESMQRSGAAYSNGFIGIGGAHSSNNKIDNGMSASDWSKISSIVGHSVKNASDFFKLSSKEMAKLAEEDTTLYSKIKGLADDGYKDAAQYMDEYITYYKQLEELENAYNEKLTNTSFDSVRDNFKSALLDMESDAEDFANSFEKMMQNAVIESLMTSKYDKLIQDWYTDFAKAMEDGKIDEYEQDFLQKKWNNIVDQGLAERNALKEAMGWESSFSSSQSSTSGGFQTMSQDTGDELNGRFTALQMAGEEIKIQSEFQSQSLNLLTAKADAILSVNTEVRNIADETRTLIANSYLELVQISENTGNTVKYLKDIQTDMAEVKNNTKGLVR